MKTAVLLAAAGLAASVAAQSRPRPTGTILDAVPECAHKCLSEAINNGTPCDVADGDCLCIPDNYYAIYDAGNACVLLDCGAALSLEEVLPQAQQYCADITGGSAEVTGTDIVTSLPSVTTASGASETAPSNDTSSSTSTGEGAASSSTDQPDAAATLAHLSGLGLLALGALAAF